ncbi:late embryogenesis abundant protein Lea5-like [Actinidia eriantha]|uniref:late embryogenesis abundant protein Lea5-like n=1 Tax=Actinidia eriantha TaxID=165200 RepID=UPI00258412B1|nr:late embryogenesis abundant protein Lea5-like [Actinidia eriantha]
MSRSFSNAKLLSALVADKISMVLSRRGYAAAAASQGIASGSVRGGVAARGGVIAKKGGKTSWVPDPVTGYYRPENRAIAELREMLLTKDIRRH